VRALVRSLRKGSAVTRRMERERLGRALRVRSSVASGNLL
jgi:hypothetical protein